ncbi:UNVERIFIED_CONTAM: hypothetical protein PYX00_006355 [Menopon gallinae]|uniref:Uncharacterized protein n=1 Tax=Menopon gallinae TaxID=328185 RepID=A0AAW2HV10_9NEOP
MWIILPRSGTIPYVETAAFGLSLCVWIPLSLDNISPYLDSPVFGYLFIWIPLPLDNLSLSMWITLPDQLYIVFSCEVK